MTHSGATPLSWSGIIAGALVAAGTSAVLLAFGSAIGLASASTSPSWRDASIALWILSGIYMLLVAFVSFGLGGYIAGRLTPVEATAAEPNDSFRSGVHGLTMWALAVVLGIFLTLGITRSDPVSRGFSAQSDSLLDYEIDRLFRGERRSDADIAVVRPEANRILLTSSSHSGVSADDRTYLARLVAAHTGIPSGDADRRVAIAIERSHEAIGRMRHSAVITAFMVAASLLAGAAIAWMTAQEGALNQLGRSEFHTRWGWRLHGTSTS
jgi:hypothetical protein